MYKKARVILIALGVLIGGSAWATTMIQLDRQDLLQQADLIVEGRVALPPKPFVEGPGQIVFSKITILVEEYYNTSSISPQQEEIRHIEILQPGGTYNGRTTVVPGMPSFRPNERVFLYLKRNPRTGDYNVVGLSQGKFEIKTEAGTGLDYLVPSVIGVNLVSTQPAAQQAGKAAPTDEAAPARKAGKLYLKDVIGEIQARQFLQGPEKRMLNE